MDLLALGRSASLLKSLQLFPTASDIFFFFLFSFFF